MDLICDVLRTKSTWRKKHSHECGNKWDIIIIRWWFTTENEQMKNKVPEKYLLLTKFASRSLIFITNSVIMKHSNEYCICPSSK